MKRTFAVFALVALAAFMLPHGHATAQGQKGLNAATGPFTYTPAIAGSSTFLGAAGGPGSGAFQVTAPVGGTIFPSGGSTALAEIHVFGIEMVGDAEGVPLAEPIKIALDSALGTQIADAFMLSPTSYAFSPGTSVDVEILIYNPMVEASAFGDYVVTMKAQAIGSGIGVGSGSRYHLNLRAPTDTDTTPPTVTINHPADGGPQLLGPIPVQIRANDPVPGSGVASISAVVSSAGGTVMQQALTLADTTPQPAGTDATAAGTFTPTGGSGPAGTTEATAFTSASRSGIGTYTIDATATDGEGNVGMASATFQVKYDVAFTQAEGQVNSGKPGNSQGKFTFTVKRSALTSDGAFLFDNTVVVKLVRVTDEAVMSMHTRTSGAGVLSQIVYNDAPAYQTHFRRNLLIDPHTAAAPTTSASYKVKVYVLDVDKNLVVQAESEAVTF